MNQKITYIKIADLEPSSLNPRKAISDHELSELGISIKQHGILQPLTVRKSGKKFEIVCGERRYRAAHQFGATTVPVIIKELSDEEAQEIMLVENIQRENIHPMEEALTLEKLQDQGLTIDQLSTKLGKSTIYIQKRMKLLELIPAAQKQFASGEIEYNQAIQIARLQEDDQKKVLENATTGYGKDKRMMDSRKLAEYIQDNIMLQFKDAVFKLDDANLVPRAGACDTCPKRTRNRPELFDTAEKDDKCVDAACFKLKTSAFMKRRQEELKAKHGEVATASMDYSWSKTVKVKGQDLEILKKKVAGSIPVLITSGGEKGRTVFVAKPDPAATEIAKKTDTTKAVDQKKKDENEKIDRQIRGLFLKNLFLEVFRLVENMQFSDDCVDLKKYVRAEVFEGNLPGWFNDYQNSLLVACGIKSIDEKSLFSSLKSVNKKDTDQLMGILNAMPLENVIVLMIAGSDDAVEDIHSSFFDERNNDLIKIASLLKIDWKTKWKAFQEANKPATEVKKVAPAAKKMASDANKVASKAKVGKGLKALLTDAE